MKISLNPFLVMFLCVLAASVGASTRVQPLLGRDALIGKWKATITADDSGKETNDNLEFKGGKFTSETEKNGGFDPATYEDDPAPQGMGAAKFDVTLTNKAGDTAKWSGTAAGGEMTGTLVISKKDGSTITYTFKGTRS